MKKIQCATCINEPVVLVNSISYHEKLILKLAHSGLLLAVLGAFGFMVFGVLFCLGADIKSIYFLLRFSFLITVVGSVIGCVFGVLFSSIELK